MNTGQSARLVYAKICALIILTYVLLMGIVGFIISQTIEGLRIGLQAGLMFSIPAIVLLGGIPLILHYLNSRAFQGKMKYPEDTTTHPTRTIDVDLPKNAVFDLVFESLPLLTLPPNTPSGILFGKLKWRLNNTSASRGKGVIITWLRQRWSWYNTSRVTIHLQQLDENTTRIVIRSQPQWSIFVFDYGLNLHNVVMLAQHIREQAHLKNAETNLHEGVMDDVALDTLLESAQDTLSET